MRPGWRRLKTKTRHVKNTNQKTSGLAESPKAQILTALTSAGLRAAQRKTKQRRSDKNWGGVRAGWRGKCQIAVCHASLRSRFGDCLRRIQIAERNEAERGQAGDGRMITRRAVE